MKKIVLVLLSLLFVATIKANDAVFYMSGSTLVPIEETKISISKEILTITVGKDDYATVDVYYEFYNPRRKKTVSCDALTSVTCKNPTPPLIFDSSFDSSCKNATLYVPKGSKKAYQSAAYWKNFKNIVEK